MDQIQRKHWVTADYLYWSLRSELGCKKGKEHFANMYTFSEVEDALEALERIAKRLRKAKRKKVAAHREKEATINKESVVNIVKKIPQTKYQEAMEKLKKENAFIAGFPAFLQPTVRRLIHR